MGALTLLVLLLLFSRRDEEPLFAPAPAMPPRPPPPPPPPTLPPAAQHAAVTPPPWPQAIPAGLPPWPSGWQPDEPPGPGVVTRAWQLLSQLWAHGAGTRKTEQTNGRWITYVAAMMPGGKKGVVAYRPSSPSPIAQQPRTSDMVPVSHVEPSPRPASAPAPSSPLALPTLRQGASGGAVVTIQKRLGIAADGKFGPATKAAVIAFQRSRGLNADGVVGPKTWTALMA